MEQTENIDPEYIRGFNDGYMLAKKEPDVLNALESVKGNSERFQGIKDGMQQYSKELLNDKRPDWLKKDRIAGINKNDITKDKDLSDRER